MNSSPASITIATVLPDWIVGVGNFSWSCDHLSQLHLTVTEFHRQAMSNLETQFNRLPPTSDEDELSHRGDWYSDTKSQIGSTNRIIHAGLAVAIASHIESCFEFFCKRCGITLPNRANWGNKRQALEAKLGSSGVILSTLNGYDSAQKSRLLGNCFKHNEGRMTDEYNNSFGGKRDQIIEYESEPWPQLIGDVNTFLHEVFKLARQHFIT